MAALLAPVRPAGSKPAAVLQCEGKVSAFAFAPDGKRLASASWDRTLRVWDVAGGRTIAELKGHTQNIMQVAFLSADGARLVSSAYDLTLRVWETAEQRERMLAQRRGSSTLFFDMSN